MCVMCYLSTDRVIEDAPFDEYDPKFNVQRVEERSCHLTKQFVYYCGAYEKCGCAFGSMLHITEDILQRIGQELQSSGLTDETILFWWEELFEDPPENTNEFDELAEQVRASHRDTAAMYRLIEETCQAGFDCELLICWAGNENNTIGETFLVHATREQINIDFNVARKDEGYKVFLYRFLHA